MKDWQRLFISALIFASVVAGFPLVGTAQNPIIRNDTDGDDRLSPDEFPGPPHAFDRIDQNGDGYLTLQELRQGRQGRRGGRSGQRGGGRFPPAPKLARTPSASWRYVDTHMHLHPIGLDNALGHGRGGGDERPDLAEKLEEAADKLIARMDSFGLERALIVVVPSNKLTPGEDFYLMRDAVRSQSDRLFLMAGGATLGSTILQTPPDKVTSSISSKFVAQAKKLLSAGARGFGEMISYHLCMTQRHSFKFALPDHPLFLKLSDIAAKNNVPIDLHMEAIETAAPMPENLKQACDKNPDQLTPTIPSLEQLLAHNRITRIVWQHVGWDNVGQMKPVLLDRLLRQNKNLFMALRVERRPNQVGGGGPMPNRIVDTNANIHPEWLKLMTDHQDRLVIGSDEFVGPSGKEPKGAASYTDTWAMVSRLPPDIAAKIGRENALRIYNLR